jgi:hypothetical protein
MTSLHTDTRSASVSHLSHPHSIGNPQLLPAHPQSISIEEGVTVSSKDVGHFELGTDHGCDRPSADGPRRSSGLCVVASATAEPWV